MRLIITMTHATQPVRQQQQPLLEVKCSRTGKQVMGYLNNNQHYQLIQFANAEHQFHQWTNQKPRGAKQHRKVNQERG